MLSVGTISWGGCPFEVGAIEKGNAYEQKNECGRMSWCRDQTWRGRKSQRKAFAIDVSRMEKRSLHESTSQGEARAWRRNRDGLQSRAQLWTKEAKVMEGREGGVERNGNM